MILDVVKQEEELGRYIETSRDIYDVPLYINGSNRYNLNFK